MFLKKIIQGILLYYSFSTLTQPNVELTVHLTFPTLEGVLSGNEMFNDTESIEFDELDEALTFIFQQLQQKKKKYMSCKYVIFSDIFALSTEGTIKQTKEKSLQKLLNTIISDAANKAQQYPTNGDIPLITYLNFYPDN